MNKVRRKRVDDVIAKLYELQEELESIFDEESEYRDNIPENMQTSERYENAETNCDNLESAKDSIDEIIDYLEKSKN